MKVMNPLFSDTDSHYSDGLQSNTPTPPTQEEQELEDQEVEKQSKT